MKLIITQENFKKALTTVSRVINSKTGLSILNNLLLYTDSNRLIINSTNMDVAISENINAKIEKEGKIVVPAKLLTEFISNLPKVNINLELINDKLKIEAGSYKSTINTINPKDFPEIPEIKKAEKITINTQDFKDIVNQTTNVTSGDVSRPILTGVYMYTNGDTLSFVATDGYRLAEKQITNNNNIKAIIPASTLSIVSQSIPEELEDINILINEDQVSFILNNIEITSRLISGNFIDYQGLIPSKTENNFTLSKDEFLRTIKISELFARETAGVITIKIDEKKSHITIQSIASEFGENTSELTAKVKGSAEISLNARYLIEALNCISSEEIEFNFSGKLAPILLKGVEDISYKHIIMPTKS
ncbi:DNA polymerase III subunit beta [Candidatus Saccharibacteria bacterium]|nr:DNA polymerase III subunit beta [Candidatus Saccharibacteria bacterium]